MLLFGRLQPGSPTAADGETSNGTVPDASPRELTALVPVAAVALLLGVWPSPIFGAIAVAASDSSADVVSEP